MRTKSTNLLQAVVLFSGISYVLIGILFYISPLMVLQFFVDNVSESWIDLVRENELVAPLYYIARGFAALLFSAGLSMVMPLFDPLKYRGMIYYNGVIFPFMSALLLMKNSVFFIFFNKQPDAESASGILSLISRYHGHMVVLILGIIFTLIFTLSAIGLGVTRKQARAGVE